MKMNRITNGRPLLLLGGTREPNDYNAGELMKRWQRITMHRQRTVTTKGNREKNAEIPRDF